MQLLPALLLDILRHNYSMVHIPWGIAHNSYPLKAAGNTWDTALPTMDAVTAPQLAYDLWTTEQIRCACTAAHTRLADALANAARPDYTLVPVLIFQYVCQALLSSQKQQPCVSLLTMRQYL